MLGITFCQWTLGLLLLLEKAKQHSLSLFMLVFLGSVRTEKLKSYLPRKDTTWSLIPDNHNCDSCWYSLA